MICPILVCDRTWNFSSVVSHVILGCQLMAASHGVMECIQLDWIIQVRMCAPTSIIGCLVHWKKEKHNDNSLLRDQDCHYLTQTYILHPRSWYQLTLVCGEASVSALPRGIRLQTRTRINSVLRGVKTLLRVKKRFKTRLGMWRPPMTMSGVKMKLFLYPLPHN